MTDVSSGVIPSARLDLCPLTPPALRALIDGDVDAAATLIGASIPPGWPDDAELLALRLGQLDEDPSLQEWLLRAICARGGHEVVGHIGFHTAPGPDYLDEWFPGAVEFGFTIVPDRRRMGYATEASVALMEWARSVHQVPGFVLTVSPDNTASQRLAAALGFRRVGSHEDETDGTEDVLVLRC